jgi:hypothetical protein
MQKFSICVMTTLTLFCTTKVNSFPILTGIQPNSYLPAHVQSTDTHQEKLRLITELESLIGTKFSPKQQSTILNGELHIKDPNLLYHMDSTHKMTIMGKICEMTWLTSLTISYASLTKIPQEIGNLTNLEELNLSNNLIRRIPFQIQKLKNTLKTIHLSFNLIEEIQPMFGDFEKLEFLGLSGNQFTTVPSDFYKLRNKTVLLQMVPALKNRSTEYNLLGREQLVMIFGKIPLLLRSDTPITEDVNGQPNSLAELNWRVLQLSELLMIMEYKGSLDRFEIATSGRLNLSGALKNLDENTKQMILEMTSRMDWLKMLDLSSNDIQSIPVEFGNLKNLRALNISNNRTMILPSSITDNKNIRIIDLDPFEILTSSTFHERLGRETLQADD